MTHPLHSSERTDWQTPAEVLDHTRQVGAIVLDPCTTYRNPTGAALFYSHHDPASEIAQALARAEQRELRLTGAWLGPDGLAASLPTVGLSFWNPPYGRHLSGEIDPRAPITHKGQIIGYGTGWGRKWAQHRGERIALVPNRTETEWWGEMADAAVLFCFPDHRIAFVDPRTGKPGTQPNHGSTIFYSGPQPEAFRQAFGDFGRIFKGGASE